MKLPTVSVRDLGKALVTLPTSRLAYLMRDHIQVPPEHLEDVPLSTQVQLAVADWLAHLGFLDEHQQVLILEKVGNDILRMAPRLRTAIEDETARPLFTITISDQRFVHTTTMTKFYDFTTGRALEVLPAAPVTIIVCNVLALHARLAERLQTVQKLAAAS